VPEHVRGQFTDAAYGDTLQWISATLARVEARQEVMERTLAALTAQLADLDAVLRRAAEPAPARRTRTRARRGETVLRVVQAVVLAAIGLGVAAAALAPAQATHHRAEPRRPAACSRAAACHSGRNGQRRDA
jgi:type II secretory pathway component PulJ